MTPERPTILIQLLLLLLLLLLVLLLILLLLLFYYYYYYVLFLVLQGVAAQAEMAAERVVSVVVVDLSVVVFLLSYPSFLSPSVAFVFCFCV